MSAVLPYAGTSGWSGSRTSEERARQEDENGTTSWRQSETLGVLFDAGYFEECVDRRKTSLTLSV